MYLSQLVTELLHRIGNFPLLIRVILPYSIIGVNYIMDQSYDKVKNYCIKHVVSHAPAPRSFPRTSKPHHRLWYVKNCRLQLEIQAPSLTYCPATPLSKLSEVLLPQVLHMHSTFPSLIHYYYYPVIIFTKLN